MITAAAWNLLTGLFRDVPFLMEIFPVLLGVLLISLVFLRRHLRERR